MVYTAENWWPKHLLSLTHTHTHTHTLDHKKGIIIIISPSSSNLIGVWYLIRRILWHRATPLGNAFKCRCWKQLMTLNYYLVLVLPQPHQPPRGLHSCLIRCCRRVWSKRGLHRRRLVGWSVHALACNDNRFSATAAASVALNRSDLWRVRSALYSDHVIRRAWKIKLPYYWSSSVEL